MEIKEEVKRQLRLHEGLRLKPYKCTSNKLTIGYGRNIEDVGISIGEAEYLLENDIDRCIKDLNNNLTWFKLSNEWVQVILINMTYNMGINGLLTFKNSLKLLENKQYKQAGIELRKSKWYSQVKNRAEFLINILENIK